MNTLDNNWTVPYEELHIQWIKKKDDKGVVYETYFAITGMTMYGIQTRHYSNRTKERVMRSWIE